MTMPHIVVCESEQEFDRQAADWVSERLARPSLVLGLATGSSPIGLYRELVRRHKAGDVSFHGVRAFNLDEYVGLPPNHPMSYAHYMHQHLYAHVDINLDQTHIPDGSATHPKDEADRYDALLSHYGPIEAQILGIGTNGHIGFNEPGTEFGMRTHVVRLTEDTRQSNARFFNSLEEVPQEAITVGIANILESKEIVLLARGANKAEALRRAFREAPTPDVPASALQSHPRVMLVVDGEAASLL